VLHRLAEAEVGAQRHDGQQLSAAHSHIRRWPSHAVECMTRRAT
jgi:hypothetical protein